MDKNRAIINIFASIALVDSNYGDEEFALVKDFLTTEEGCSPEVDVATEINKISALSNGEFLKIFIESANFFQGKADLQKRLHHAIFQMVFVDQSISSGEKMLYGFLSSYWGMRG